MITIWLKHAIYDRCLQTLFTSISKNFATTKIQFKVGQRFTTMILNYNQWSITDDYEVILDNAEIVDIVGDILYVEYDVYVVNDNADATNIQEAISLERDIDEVLISDVVQVF